MQSTLFWMTFGLEAVMPIEFQVPSLRVEFTERMPESPYEQKQLEQLLELGEQRIANMAHLEHGQRQRKAFVDRHRKGMEKSFPLVKRVLVFQKHRVIRNR